ncbi:MAG: hypothetical protein FJ095_07165 [Deltaproteobacteria bacterium]|nr:hypothetical protein [Deltaproteobacteria bacterium]
MRRRHQTHAAWLVVALAASCVEPRHPLASDGSADFRLDRLPLFAVDQVDEEGAPATPRQAPFEKRVQLYLTQAGSPDRGGYVDVAVDPPQLLELAQAEAADGAGPDGSCVALPGTFRCTAGADGFASFVVRSVSDQSGLAELRLVGRSEKATVEVLPAGLPPGSSGLELSIEGTSDARVHARFDKLACSLAASPDTPFDKWPTGAIRVRTARVIASPPLANPGTIEHAPVFVETLHPEAFVSLDPSCAPPHTSRVRVVLDALGRSPDIHVCFSDLGGDVVTLRAASGLNRETTRTLKVDAEPRLLRVETLVDTLPGGSKSPLLALQLSAYDADLNRVPLEVELSSSDKAVLAPEMANLKLLGKAQGDEDVDAYVTTGVAGEATITVRPLLFTTPSCDSRALEVE